MADKVHIPIVGGSCHGRRELFDNPPTVDIGIVADLTSFRNGRFERERYTLCYLHTAELERRNNDEKKPEVETRGVEG